MRRVRLSLSGHSPRTIGALLSRRNCSKVSLLGAGMWNATGYGVRSVLPPLVHHSLVHHGLAQADVGHWRPGREG
jgi:hypothetical protein